jgi:hypothetical protein
MNRVDLDEHEKRIVGSVDACKFDGTSCLFSALRVTAL